ncbi:MAG: hypothetical protein A2157_13715 [Deltaproteobacteria bacterium RBG_16_47_11]|nr:MAG: hypothetical protein A2157_13715 [Deltaproteobacteria bacterium RBG_16_47_11]
MEKEPSNKTIGAILQEMALFLELKGESPFRAKAYAVDMIRVIDEAARSGVAIELNAHPYRLDIDWRLCKYAKEKGCKIIINPDAHEEEGLRHTYFGVGIARKGWLEPGDVLNTMDLEGIRNFLEQRKKSF